MFLSDDDLNMSRIHIVKGFVVYVHKNVQIWYHVVTNIYKGIFSFKLPYNPVTFKTCNQSPNEVNLKMVK